MKQHEGWKSFRDVPVTAGDAPRMFLDYFYPIHYSIGMAIESELMSCGRLDRHQTVIMWIMRSEAQRRGSNRIDRKDIVHLMTGWYDITSSSVSKALRALSRPPLEYIEIHENPNSGREKVIVMTKAGEEHCTYMIDNACKLIDGITKNFNKEESQMGIYMFMRMEQEFKK